MSIILKDLGFEWPDGRPIFNSLNLTLNNELYALIGPNGVGKTTLAKLIAKELIASKGTITFQDSLVYYFPQFSEAPRISVTQYLMDTDAFSNSFVLNFLSDIDFEMSCYHLSGGQWMRVRLAHIFCSSANFLIFDEPTNHLDKEGRASFSHFLSLFKGGVLNITHDPDLLTKATQIIELSNKGVSIFKGKWDDYISARSEERERLEQALVNAKKKRKEISLERQHRLEQSQKRSNRGKEKAGEGGIPRILLGGRKSASEVSAGKVDRDSMLKASEAVSEAFKAYQDLKVDPVMFAKMIKVKIPQSKVIVKTNSLNVRFSGSKPLWEENLHFSFSGPVRLHIRGNNGSGKSTLLQILANKFDTNAIIGESYLTDLSIGYIDQNYTLLDFKKSVFQNVQESSEIADVELKNMLAMFLFRGDQIFQTVDTLSGGEKLRLALAKVLLATPSCQILLLDEPTNNLDMQNISFLESVLSTYQGALFVISHDQSFINNISLDEEITLIKGE